MTLFESIDETKTKHYEVLEAFDLNYTIHKYYWHSDYKGLIQYFYIRTDDDTIIDLCISEFPEVFAIHKGLNGNAIKNIFKGNL
ncbi:MULTISPECIES: hypothetical protein [Bacillus]|uniref:hypothetical protein n=1 Tax=Bacillus TaxID=1386 RepID=UPI0009935DBD|nr:hypothetical protein [Bacillus mycoides]MED0890341.1 hypothetical protein [Bacillus mycoides]MED0929695.1 hypothetical protein [Bacillus mycoides]MED1023818.1 hypothetical protein [Bacillus mycoides]MED1436814.1 hypothetical protein [Bacillus mycoides]MED1630989.1 hypothetical protein [Bacillus mycoides]